MLQNMTDNNVVKKLDGLKFFKQRMDYLGIREAPPQSLTKKFRALNQSQFFPGACAESSVITPSAGLSSRMLSPTMWRRSTLKAY